MTTLTNITKNSETLTSISKRGATGYIVTDDLSHILVGSNENETLIYVAANALTNINKNG